MWMFASESNLFQNKTTQYSAYQKKRYTFEYFAK